MKKVSLAYHASAADEVNQLIPYLKQLGWQSEASICNGPGALPLSQKVLSADGPMLLFINDALLHSLNCQAGLLEAYKEKRKEENLHVVLASSKRQGPGGVEARVLTSLTRVSDVIRYMNFWQNAYLVKRRDLGATATPESAKQLAPIRKVSQEIGETLRLIREDNAVSIYELLDQEGKLLEERLGRVSYTGETSDDSSLQAVQFETTEIEQPTEVEDIVEATISSEPNASITVEGLENTLADDSSTTPPEEEKNTNYDSPEENLTEQQDNLDVELAHQIEDTVTQESAIEATQLESESRSKSEKSLAGNPPIAQTREIASGHKDVEQTPEPTLAELAAKAQKKARKQNAKQLFQLLKQERKEEAILFAGRVLAEDPANEKVRYLHAINLLDSHHDSPAEATFQLELLLDSRYAAQASLALGRISLSERDYGSARRHLLLAHSLNEQLDAELCYQLGSLLQDEFPEHQKDAKKFIKKAVKQSKLNTSDAWYRLAQIQLQEDKGKKAVESLKKAVSFDREHPFAAYDLATLFLRKKRPVKAAQYFRKAISANPELKTEDNVVAFSPPTPEMEKDGFDRYVSSFKENSTRSDNNPEKQATNSAERGINRLTSTPLLVLITGASSGIGRATAIEFARHGHRLILTGRRIERLRGLSQELSSEFGASVRLLSYDVRNADDSAQALATLPEDWQSIDVLINNAGKAKGMDFIHEGSLKHWEEMIDTNVKGLLYATRLVSPGMVERKSGHIINVCSTAGHEVYPKGAVYCATKHAVDAITQGTRLDLHRYGIRVSQVSPAHVEETEFAAVRFDGDQERAAAVYQDFQPLRSSDVARSIYYIATEPEHVNVQDVLMLSTQQANSTTIDRSGR